jgi:hypothetical protein
MHEYTLLPLVEYCSPAAGFVSGTTAERTRQEYSNGGEPRHLPRDHFAEAAAYPTILADEINLDSPQAQKDLMLRTVRVLQSGSTAQTLLLLAAPAEQGGGRRGGGHVGDGRSRG